MEIVTMPSSLGNIVNFFLPISNYGTLFLLLLNVFFKIWVKA